MLLLIHRSNENTIWILPGSQKQGRSQHEAKEVTLPPLIWCVCQLLYIGAEGCYHSGNIIPTPYLLSKSTCSCSIQKARKFRNLKPIRQLQNTLVVRKLYPFARSPQWACARVRVQLLFVSYTWAIPRKVVHLWITNMICLLYFSGLAMVLKSATLWCQWIF